MTDRWRDSAEENRGRTPEERRQNRADTRGPAHPPPVKHPKATGREEPIHGPDGGLDSGRGFGRIGVSRSDPWASERRASEAAGRSPWHGRREDFTGRGPKNYRRPDQRILEDVSDRLTDDAIVDASDITVDVKHGEVTLSGTVKDRHQKRRAEDAAERVSGVKDVINALRIAATGKSGV